MNCTQIPPPSPPMPLIATPAVPAQGGGGGGGGSGGGGAGGAPPGWGREKRTPARAGSRIEVWRRGASSGGGTWPKLKDLLHYACRRREFPLRPATALR